MVNQACALWRLPRAGNRSWHNGLKGNSMPRWPRLASSRFGSVQRKTASQHCSRTQDAMGKTERGPKERSKLPASIFLEGSKVLQCCLQSVERSSCCLCARKTVECFSDKYQGPDLWAERLMKIYNDCSAKKGSAKRDNSYL